MIESGALVAGVLVLVVAVAVLAKRTGIASPLILLVVGIGLGYLPWIPHPEIEPELILTGVLPPLLYASALNVPSVDLRRSFDTIAGLSILLVLASSLAGGIVLLWLFPDLGIGAAIAVGAVISPTDAVAATTIARRLGLPDRLVTVLEGESLVNDASALVLLRSAVAAVGVGIDWWQVGGAFLWAVAGAIAIGVLVGRVTVWVRGRLGDPVLTTVISFLVPFLAYFPTEQVGASGVLAVVAAGIVTNQRGARVLAANQRVTDATNWRTVQFVLEQGVFLVMGMQLHGLIDDQAGGTDSWSTGVLVGLLLLGVLLVVRAVYVTGQLRWTRWRERGWLAHSDELAEWEARVEAMPDDTDRAARRRDRARHGVAQRRADIAFLTANGLDWRGGVVLGWSGMRGVVTLAAAQSLPVSFTHRQMLVLAAFTVAVVSLLGFGGTLPAVIRRLGIGAADDDRSGQREFRTLMVRVNQSAVRLLDDPAQTVIDGAPADPCAVALLRARYARAPREARPADAPDMRTVGAQVVVLRQRIREAARDQLVTEASIGAFSSRVIAAAQDYLDIEDAREGRIADL